MSCEQTRRLATFKKNFGFSKNPDFFFSKKLQKLQKKRNFTSENKKRNKILRHNKYTNVFQKTKIITYYSIKNKRKKIFLPSHQKQQCFLH
jgi:hypothetical protein